MVYPVLALGVSSLETQTVLPDVSVQESFRVSDHFVSSRRFVHEVNKIKIYIITSVPQSYTRVDYNLFGCSPRLSLISSSHVSRDRLYQRLQEVNPYCDWNVVTNIHNRPMPWHAVRIIPSPSGCGFGDCGLVYLILRSIIKTK